jgi:hypothetical protein
MHGLFNVNVIKTVNNPILNAVKLKHQFPHIQGRHGNSEAHP